jgi:hypothetical protein
MKINHQFQEINQLVDKQEHLLHNIYPKVHLPQDQDLINCQQILDIIQI